MEWVRVLVRDAEHGQHRGGLGWRPLHIDELLEAGVTRISVGGSLASAALGFVRAAARELRDQGTMDFAAEQIGQRELNEMFARAQERFCPGGSRRKEITYLACPWRRVDRLIRVEPN